MCLSTWTVSDLSYDAIRIQWNHLNDFILITLLRSCYAQVTLVPK